MLITIPHEDRFWVNTPLGVGLVLMVESSRDMNYYWTISIQKTGEILHFTSKQITMCINYTDELNLENKKPEFPSDKNL